MKIPEIVQNVIDLFDPNRETVHRWDPVSRMYNGEQKTRLCAGNFRGSLHRETCDCGTIPYLGGPRAGCPGPIPTTDDATMKHVEALYQAKEATRAYFPGDVCPHCHRGRLFFKERVTKPGSFDCVCGEVTNAFQRVDR